MAKENKGLLFFYDWRDPIEELSGDEVKALLLAMLDFSKDGTEPPQFKGGAKIAAAFMFPAIDRFRKQSEAGRKGGTTTQEARRAANEVKTEAPFKDASKGAAEGSSNDGSRVVKQQHNTTQIQNNNNTIGDIYEPDESVSLSPPKKKEPERHKYGEYENVLLSDEEYHKLQEEFPTDYGERIERLSGYIASTGKKYTSHLATIRNWAKKDAEQPYRNTGQSQQGDGWDYIYAVAEGRA